MIKCIYLTSVSVCFMSYVNKRPQFCILNDLIFRVSKKLVIVSLNFI